MTENPVGTGSQSETTKLSIAGARWLAKMAGATSEGTVAKLGHHALATTVAIERVANDASGAKTLAGIRVMCELDGHPMPALTAGSVGIDITRDAALSTAMQEWAMEFGSPVVDALTGKPPKLHVGAFDVYPGLTGIRGTKPDRLDNVDEPFFREVTPLLSQLMLDQALHTLMITLVWSPDSPPDGEFRVDGEVSESLKQIALKVKWPAGKARYMLKQYYVLTSATGNNRPSRVTRP